MEQVKKETNRLRKIFRAMPANKFALAQNLIVEAARLKAQLDVLWKDIEENGSTEMFAQSDKADPYERERPAARQYIATNKQYQSIMKQLIELCPEAQETDALDEFRD